MYMFSTIAIATLEWTWTTYFEIPCTACHCFITGGLFELELWCLLNHMLGIPHAHVSPHHLPLKKTARVLAAFCVELWASVAQSCLSDILGILTPPRLMIVLWPLESAIDLVSYIISIHGASFTPRIYFLTRSAIATLEWTWTSSFDIPWTTNYCPLLNVYSS